MFGVVLAYSSRLVWPRVAHEYANVRRDTAAVQFCTYTDDTGLLAQAYSNELPAAHVSSKQSYTTHTPATNQINATATTTTTYTSINETKRAIDLDVIKNESAMNVPYKKKVECSPQKSFISEMIYYIINPRRLLSVMF